MAGDWIKMRGNLWDDPRVARLCDATDQSEAPIIGALYWLWATADQHTENGIMPGLTLRAIDRKTGIQGFAQALCDIGWLADHPEGVRLVKFEEHNGASAKRRCMDAQRKAGVRSVSASSADKSRTGEGEHEDELRRLAELEKENKEKCTHTPLREGWVLPKAYGDWAIAEFPHWTAETVRAIAATFADHWRASGGSSADWDATWRKWCCDPLTQKAHPAPKAAAVKAVAAPPKTVPSNSAEQTKALLRQQEEHAAEVERQRLARIAKRTQQEAA